MKFLIIMHVIGCILPTGSVITCWRRALMSRLLVQLSQLSTSDASFADAVPYFDDRDYSRISRSNAHYTDLITTDEYQQHTLDTWIQAFHAMVAYKDGARVAILVLANWLWLANTYLRLGAGSLLGAASSCYEVALMCIFHWCWVFLAEYDTQIISVTGCQLSLPYEIKTKQTNEILKLSINEK